MAKILAIEDEPVAALTLQAIVEEDDHDFVSETSAQRALDSFQREKPDLVLLDLLFPDGNGFDICEAIRARSEVPIIVVSSIDNEDKIIEGYSLGADDFIIKPVTAGELKAKIQVHLRRMEFARTGRGGRPITEGIQPSGEPFGKYILLNSLGRGGMGEVYKAHVLGRPHDVVALKKLKASLVEDRSFLQRFLQETEFAKAVEDPYVIRIRDSGYYRGNYYYTMDYIEGPSLYEDVRMNGKLDLRRALKLTRQILHALASIHEAGLLHRDVSPKNILLTEKGRIKLIDFGIAQPSKSKQVTTTQTILGTPNYIAPEVGRGAEPNIQSDLYSVGIVLYYMLVGAPPFDGEPLQIMYKQAHEEIVIPADVPPEVAQFIQCLTASAPTSRPGSPGEALVRLVSLRESMGFIPPQC